MVRDAPGPGQVARARCVHPARARWEARSQWRVVTQVEADLAVGWRAAERVPLVRARREGVRLGGLGWAAENFFLLRATFNVRRGALRLSLFHNIE